MNNNLNLYYIFYEVAKSGNISRAAKELYISQPAISKAVNKLENSLEATLFIRNSRGVTLTSEGEVLFEQIKNAFDAIKTGEEKVKMIGELGIGHLSIGVSTTLAKHVLLPYLKKYVSKNPHIKVTIQCQSSLETMQALEQGKIDIGLIGYPTFETELSYKPLMDIHDAFVTTENYLKNFSVRDELTKEKLASNATFMMLNKENITRKYIDKSLNDLRMELQNIIEVSNMDLLIDFAKIDLGISCVIKEFVTEELNKSSLIEVKMLGKMPARQIGLAYLDSHLKSNPCIEAFINSCI